MGGRSLAAAAWEARGAVAAAWEADARRRQHGGPRGGDGVEVRGARRRGRWEAKELTGEGDARGGVA